LRGKNSFTEVSKNLARYISENNFVEHNYVERSNWLLECQNFLQHWSLWLSVLHILTVQQNYLDSLRLDTNRLDTSHSQHLNSGKPLSTGRCGWWYPNGTLPNYFQIYISSYIFRYFNKIISRNIYFCNCIKLYY